MKRRVFVGILVVVILILAIAIIIDAKIVRDLMTQKISGSEYTAHFPNLSQSESYSIIYVSKERLDPYFGQAFYEFGHGIALVQADLPEDVQKFVLMHELYHLQDHKHKNIISREIHATFAAIPYSPIGFIRLHFFQFLVRID